MVASAPRPVAGLTLRLVGEFAVLANGRPLTQPAVGSRKARTLLKRLAVEQDGWLHLDQIVDALWDDVVPARPADSVATLVSRLRATLGDAIVQGGRDAYRLGQPPAVDVDLAIAARDVAQARQRYGSGEYALAAATADRALSLLGDGRALVADDDVPWVEPARGVAVSLLREARELAGEAALAVGDAATARGHATASIAADPFDEQAYRLAMRAEVLLGAHARALATYGRLRTVLATELGADPAPESRNLYEAVLREQPLPERPVVAPPRATAITRRAVLADHTALVGRRDALAAATAHWSAASGGEPSLLLIVGEAGIGKTALAAALAEIASSTGGTVLRARCYEAERSLFLQPIADALGDHAATANPATIRAVAGEWSGPVAALVPQVAAIVDPLPAQEDRGDAARRRSYEAFTRYVCSLATSPVMLLLDDLHQAGLATVELLHYLVRQAGNARLLVVATVRAEEGTAVLSSLLPVSDRIDLGPLEPEAIAQLAAAAGHAELADRIATRTRGHTLFVVETLRALAIGDSSVPESLQAAVLSRVARTGERTAAMLRAAAVLGTAIEPDVLARMLDISSMDATERCEKALAAHLLVVAERAYEFANDLIREVLYASMPTPTSITMHRRAADLQVDRPERVGAHAAAAGDWKRAAKAWLIAGEQANQRVAFADAEALLTRAIEATAQVADDEVAGRAHLARGRARDAMTSYVGALGDYETAAHVAKRAGDRRLEMLALRELGGDVPVALSTSVTQCTTRLRTGLALAEELGDRAMEADILSRLAVIASNRLLFTDSLAYGHRAVRAARASGDSHVIALALDGLKTGYAYLGEIQALAPIVVELEPLLRRHHLTWLLPWTIQESAFPAIAEGRWDDALMRLTEALDLNRRSGYVAYEGWFVGNIGWVHRLRGDLDAALDFGRQAVHLTRNLLHPWGCSAACSQYGTTLLAAGQRAAAVEMLMLGRGYAEYEGAEAYLLNCLGPLAEATGDPDVLARADRLAAGVRVPTGSVWMLGAESAIAMGRAWLASGEPTKALAIVTPLIDAAGRTGWGWVREAAEQVAAACEQSAVPQI